MTFLFVRRKNFEKNEMYKKAFKSSDDGVVSNQPGKWRRIFFFFSTKIRLLVLLTEYIHLF